MASTAAKPLFYDIGAIKDIPILEVAEQLGIDVQKRGKNYWCKVRDEKNPSVVLHPDRNSFYDFGNQKHGDVIRFVQYAKDLEPGPAIRFLAESFGIEPSMTKEAILDRPLTNWEYSKIGLHGDMASKNLVFPIETATMEELADLSWCYRMPLNTLLQEDPKAYQDLIAHKAVPFVEELRNSYYMDIWNRFELTYMMGDNSINLFRSDAFRERFKKDTAVLNKVERILFRAQKKAGMDAPEPPQYDPVNVLKQLLHGQLGISLGNIRKEDLQAQAKRYGCEVRQAKLSLAEYFNDRLLSLGHAAEYRGRAVSVQYLSLDAPVVEPVIASILHSSDHTALQRAARAVDAERIVNLQRKEEQKEFEIH